MNIETAAKQLNQILASAYANPYKAMDDLSGIFMPPEISGLRDVAMSHIAFLCKLWETEQKNKQNNKIYITRVVEARVRILFAQGASQSEIADIMGISGAAVSLLIHGKYNFVPHEAVKPRKKLSKEKELKFDGAYKALLARTEKQRKKITARH